ncbi:Phosphatidylinositol glycan anchor biosynthesis class U protein [Zea mays]|uniref:Phosphatidylinositol glycan anchor biosynthesis class U protein n=1 Tax=Zea mays TaxID=4577 RepID=A0A3L6EPZ3_MAIZE|nr:Phosphatidylinositol glycan anchor biosynthesis class U protein [Zea mays]
MAIRYWPMAGAAVGFRLVLVLFGGDLHLASRPEVSTPLTSLRRLAEGYWLKQASVSPYSGSMYHGSPLLLSVLGPLTSSRPDGHHAHIYCRLVLIIHNDIIDAVNVSAGDVASLIYLWNPWAIVTCVGSCTSPIENLMVVIMIYGSCSRLAPLAAFGYVMATHLSLYPAILIVPVILLLGYGLDAPPPKVFLIKGSIARKSDVSDNDKTSRQRVVQQFSWKPVLHFIFWLFIWSCHVLLLSSVILKKVGGLHEMFEKTYGFILTVKDLSPNIGVLWYFFAEVFDFFRNFFLMVFNMNIIFMVLPLAIRLKHRPCFLAFVYTAIVAILKSYPSAGDSALYLGLLGLFVNELAEMQFTFFLFFGYIGVSLLSPVMHNLWIWRGTGNANFYFATGLAYTCLQVTKYSYHTPPPYCVAGRECEFNDKARQKVKATCYKLIWSS